MRGKIQSLKCQMRGFDSRTKANKAVGYLSRAEIYSGYFLFVIGYFIGPQMKIPATDHFLFPHALTATLPSKIISTHFTFRNSHPTYTPIEIDMIISRIRLSCE